MFSFFSSIAGVITTAVNYIVNFFMMLVTLLVSMARAVVWLFACIAALPPFLTAFVLVPVSLAIFFQVMNKGN